MSNYDLKIAVQAFLAIPIVLTLFPCNLFFADTNQIVTIMVLSKKLDGLSNILFLRKIS